MGLIPGLAQWVKDLAWQGATWVAVAAPIRPLAWELPYATGVVIEIKKEKERKNISVTPKISM